MSKPSLNASSCELTRIDAIRVYEQTREKGLAPSISILCSALKACSALGELQTGTRIHDYVQQSGDIRSKFVANSLLNMYAKCGRMDDALKLFNRIERSVISWNSIIFGYAQAEDVKLALEAFGYMQQEDRLKPDAVTYVAALTACSSSSTKEEGRQMNGKLVKLHSLEIGMALHRVIKQRGFEIDVHVASSLVNMYAKCGSMEDAQVMFDRIPEPTLVSWNALMFGYAEGGESETALRCLAEIQSGKRSLKAPGALSYLAAIKACATGAASDSSDLAKTVWLERGMAVHSLAAEAGHESDTRVANSLIHMYGQCKCMRIAKDVFHRMKQRAVVSWNAVLFGYVDNNENELALQFFLCMHDGLHGIQPDALSYVAALKACANGAAEDQNGEKWLSKGKTVHFLAAQSGLESDLAVGNALLLVYTRCGAVEQARDFFNRMLHRSVVSWNTIISGYMESGNSSTALKLFTRMQREGVTPNALAYVTALKSCGWLGALERGRRIHSQIRDASLENDALVESSLIDFYGRCGSMDEAEQVFRRSSNYRKDLVSWSALIAGYGQQGNAEQVLGIFEKMQDEQIKPDAVTFLSVLSACSHSGLVEKGKKIFDVMEAVYGVVPGCEHYTCMVDMLCRANKLEEAFAMLKRMPYEADERMWTVILDSCLQRKNVRLAQIAFEALLRFGNHNNYAGAYVLMSKTYARIAMEEKLK